MEYLPLKSYGIMFLVPPSMVEWIRSLDFGFVEFDCLLIHGTSVTVSEALTPDSSPWMILDRLQQMNVNYLFSGRSSLLYEYFTSKAFDED